MFESIKEDPQETKDIYFAMRVLGHTLFSIFPLAMPIGCFAELQVDAMLPMAEPFMPGICAIAALGGFFVGYRTSSKAAIRAWIPTALLLTCVLAYSFATWTPEDLQWTGYSRFLFAWYRAFGSSKHCAATECIGHIVIGAPFLASASYSAAAKFGLVMKKREEDRSERGQ